MGYGLVERHLAMARPKIEKTIFPQRISAIGSHDILSSITLL